jgi:SAM-dependent methyltransferase
MGALRLYLPLIGFIVPTVVIGYGFVIPGSVIHGVNALTLGFAGTIIGASITYIAGVRMALQPACPISKPLSVRINQWINRQAAHPSGLFATLLAFVWKRDHRKINETTLGLLEISPNHSVLEIGFGPGETLAAAARRCKSITGVEVSESMLRIATRRNRRAIRKGGMTLWLIENGKLGLDSVSIDRAYSVHTIYFWSNPQQTFAQIARALAPGGRLIIGMRPNSDAIPQRFRDPSYRFYESWEIEGMLVTAGFVSVRTLRRPEIAKDFVWVVADR